jgi:Ca2+-binding RTX toxin-like protein
MGTAFDFGSRYGDRNHLWEAEFGTQIITDFKANGDHDFIEIRHGIVSGAQDVLAAAKQTGNDVTITLPSNFIAHDPNVIILKNFSLANLQASDFIISRDLNFASMGTLNGGDGDDDLMVLNGDDTLIGHAANDRLWGEPAATRSCSV